MPSTGEPRAERAPAPPVTLGVLSTVAGAARVVAADPAGADPAAEVRVTGVTHDSGSVRPGDLFAALPGSHHHGSRFTAEAAASGAVGVLTDEAGRDAARAAGLPALVVPDPRAVLGEVAATVHGHPADGLLVLGVTGTNGKTTTAHLLHAALRLEDPLAGLVGTVETRVGDEVHASVRTTPEATDLQALLAGMRDRGSRSVAMEASSIAVSMGRVGGLRFDVVGFTNLSQDHLDFHGDMTAYLDAKAELFTEAHARQGVVVVDDEAGREVVARAEVPVTTASVDGTVSGDGDGADWRATDLEVGADGSTAFTVTGPDGASARALVRLPGRFNVANALLAVVMLVRTGRSLTDAVAGVASCEGVPGRMERVDRGQPFLAVVDYAHTPDAVARLLEDVRAGLPGDPRVLTVLGCGGDRDAAKRPLMGEAAARGSDVLVVTDDNPRSEDPATIRAQVLAGAGTVPAAERGELLEVADRAEAIRTAVRRARPGDVVVVAGKGHEQGQEVAGRVTRFDDREVLGAAIQEDQDVQEVKEVRAP